MLYIFTNSQITDLSNQMPKHWISSICCATANINISSLILIKLLLFVVRLFHPKLPIVWVCVGLLLVGSVILMTTILKRLPGNLLDFLLFIFGYLLFVFFFLHKVELMKDKLFINIIRKCVVSDQWMVAGLQWFDSFLLLFSLWFFFFLENWWTNKTTKNYSVSDLVDWNASI